MFWGVGSREWAQELRLTDPRGWIRSHGAWVELPCNTWNLPGPGTETVSSALAGGFLSMVPPGKYLEGLLRVHAPEWARTFPSPAEMLQRLRASLTFLLKIEKEEVSPFLP